MSNREQISNRPLNRLNRVTALVLASVWILAGVVAIVLGFLKSRWLLPVFGTIAIGYGLLWLQVFRKGRRLTWPERHRGRAEGQ